MAGIIDTGLDDKQHNEFIERFSDKTVEQLVEIFNQEQPKRGWVSARGRFLAALCQAFLESGIDCSSFISGNNMSLSHQIRLEGDRITQIPTTSSKE